MSSLPMTAHNAWQQAPRTWRQHRCLAPSPATHGLQQHHSPVPHTACHHAATARRQATITHYQVTSPLDVLAAPAPPIQLPAPLPSSAWAPHPTPSNIVFAGSTLQDLQSTISACRRPTVIDLGGREVRLGDPAGPCASDALGVHMLHLDRDGVTLTNGRLLLQSGCTIHVAGRNATLHNIEVVEAPLEQPSLLAAGAGAEVEDDGEEVFPASSSTSADEPWPLVTAMGANLTLDGCTICAAERPAAAAPSSGAGSNRSDPSPRDLVQCFSDLRMRYCRLGGGNNACMAVDGARVALECCSLSGYHGVGLLAVGSDAHVLGSRFQGAASSAKGIAANAGAHVQAVGCSVEGHTRADVCCNEDSSVEMDGCVVGRAGTRAGPALATSGQALLHDCGLEGHLYVVAGSVQLHGCSMQVAAEVSAGPAPTGCSGLVSAGHVFDADVRMVACRSDQPMTLWWAGRSRIDVVDCPQIFEKRAA